MSTTNTLQKLFTETKSPITFRAYSKALRTNVELIYHPEEKFESYITDTSPYGSSSMNVKSMDKRGLRVYTYDVMGNRTSTLIKWDTIEADV